MHPTSSKDYNKHHLQVACIPSSEHVHAPISSSRCYNHATGAVVKRCPRMSWLSGQATPTREGEGQPRPRAVVARAGTREVAPLRADVHEHRRGAAVTRAGIGKAAVSCAGTIGMGEYLQRPEDAHTGVVKASCGGACTRGRATAATCGCSARIRDIYQSQKII